MYTPDVCGYRFLVSKLDWAQARELTFVIGIPS